MVQLKLVDNHYYAFLLMNVEFLASVEGDVSLQCEKGDVDTFFSSTNASTIRAQDGTIVFLSLEIFWKFI